MTEEACFDFLPRHQREVLDYIIEPNEPFTQHTIMIGGMNPNNVKARHSSCWHREAQNAEG